MGFANTGGKGLEEGKVASITVNQDVPLCLAAASREAGKKGNGRIRVGDDADAKLGEFFRKQVAKAVGVDKAGVLVDGGKNIERRRVCGE